MLLTAWPLLVTAKARGSHDTPKQQMCFQFPVQITCAPAQQSTPALNRSGFHGKLAVHPGAFPSRFSMWMHKGDSRHR